MAKPGPAQDQTMDEILASIRQMISDAGPSRYCLMISEEAPAEWARTAPLILKTLGSTMEEKK